MPKTTIDELLKAIQTVSYLKDAVDRNERSIAAIIDRLNRLESQLAASRDPDPGRPRD